MIKIKKLNIIVRIVKKYVKVFSKIFHKIFQPNKLLILQIMNQTILIQSLKNNYKLYHSNIIHYHHILRNCKCFSMYSYKKYLFFFIF